jgi:hypothetical protein
MLEMVYNAENNEIKKLIDNEMLVVQKKIMESNKGSSGLIMRFWGGGKVNIVNVNEVWVKLGKNSSVSRYKCLVS